MNVDDRPAASHMDQISQLVLHERQARDRGWWHEMAATYWPDSQVNLSWYTGDGSGFVARSQEMSGRGHRSVHRLSRPVIHLATDRAWVEVPASIEVRTRVDGVLVDLISYTRISYRVERRDGRWAILALDAIYERDILNPAVPGATVAIPEDEINTFRPSYALLAWHLHRSGYQIGAGLLGDDDPGPRDQFYAQTLEWLHSAR